MENSIEFFLSAAVQFVQAQYGFENVVFRSERKFILSHVCLALEECRCRPSRAEMEIFPHEIYVYLLNRLIFTCVQVRCTQRH